MWGFEPQRRRSRPTGFRIRTLQPLGYISLLTVTLRNGAIIPRFAEKSRMLFCQLHNRFHLLNDALIILPAMGLYASGAILNTAFRIGKAAAAFISQRVQRTITKQTAEAFRVCACMAREIFTFFILKKVVVRHFCFSFTAGSIPAIIILQNSRDIPGAVPW